MLDRRVAFINTLMALAEKDERIVLIVADVGFKHADRFKEKFPDRYLNLGVTEQSIVIIAAAMALSGLKPYVYSMINFVLYRPYEMVRNAVVQHKADVKLIGVSGSAAYKFLGFSHNNLHPEEDFEVCRNIGLRQYHPSTEEGTISATVDSYKSSEPCYIRL